MWYRHVSNIVTETDDGKVTIYWGKTIKADRKVTYNMPGVVVIDSKGNTMYIVDFEIPMDHPVEGKKEKKI